MKSTWVNSGNKYVLGETSNQQEKLDPGVYRVDLDPIFKFLFLTKTDDAFKLPTKLYGNDGKFAKRCVKSYKATKNNMGVLMNGVKGTGKTVTAQLICNELKLPVLVVHDQQDGLPQFINSIQQDIVVFIDEYEKIYNRYDHSVLTVMDGVLSTTNRRFFLFTTNDAYVNPNMLQRPSRIRYVKDFGDLDRATIEEIVDDMLINTELRDETIEYLSTLETITVDIAKTLVEEVNIHNESPKVFGSYFNTKKVDNQFVIFSVEKENEVTTEKLLFPKATVGPAKITHDSIGQTLYINGDDKGVIKSVADEFVVYEDYDDNMVMVRVEPLLYRHRSFSLLV